TCLSLHARGAKDEPEVDVSALVAQYGFEGVARERNGPDIVAVHREYRLTLTLEAKGIGKGHDATVLNQLMRAYGGALKWYGWRPVSATEPATGIVVPKDRRYLSELHKLAPGLRRLLSFWIVLVTTDGVDVIEPTGRL